MGQRVQMKQEILDIINDNPKTYHTIIKKDKDMLDWINTNTLSNSNNFKTRLYSAIYQKSDICPHGNQLIVKRWSNGYKNCGPAKSCLCTRNQISNSMKKHCSSRTIEEQTVINSKRVDTMLEKYGVSYNSQREDFPIRIQVSQSVFQLLSDINWLNNEYNVKKRSASDIASELKIDYSTVLYYCKKYNFNIRQYSQISKEENQIKSFIESIGYSTIQCDRNILNGKELDLYIPEKQLAIEVNGLYWHSYHPSQNRIENIVKYNHLNKTKLSIEQGITLLHITDYEWNNKQDIVKSIILSKLKNNQTIYARKCNIELISSELAKTFLTKNHIQSFIGSSLYVGLFYNNNLVMVGSAGSNRFRKNSIELHRLSTIPFVNIIGGASRIIKFIHKHYNSPIISYCDRSKSNGKVYESIGFTKIKETQPNYFWTDGTEIINRQKTTKQSLQKWLPSYDSNLSQSDNMFNAGFRRYWDCGNYVFEFK